MKLRVVFLTLLLVSASFTALEAQTKRKPRKSATTPVVAPKSDVVDKTRARRTAETTSTATETQNEPKPVEKVESDVPAAKPEATPVQAPKPSETASSDQSETAPPDEFAGLREQIDSATTGAERISLELKLVDALVNANKRVEAVKELHTTVNLDVFDPQGFYNVGNTFARLGENDGAVQAYQKAIEQRKGRYSRAYNNIGVVMLRAGRWDESYEALMSALKLESFRYPEASYNLGRLYAARGQNDLAAREWKRVLAQNPEHKAAAEALLKLGVEGRVVVHPTVASASKPVSVKPVITEKPATEPVVSPKSSSTTSPTSNASSVRGPRTLALDQQSYDFLQRARSATEKGNTLDAVGNYQRLLSREGGYFPPANLEVSFALITLKRYDEAVSNLQLVANRDGARYPIAYFHLGRVFELQSNLGSAEEMFSKAVSLFGSQNAQFLLDVSRVREKKGDFKGALEVMEQYVALLKKQGQEPVWSDERLTALRQKISAGPKE